MAGLVPAIPIGETVRMKLYYVYILASRPGGALYVGVTNDLLRRVAQHKQDLVKGHTKRYGIDKLVYFEQYAEVRDAIQREKKHEALAASLQYATYRTVQSDLARSF
jgi:putative endonuclease